MCLQLVEADLRFEAGEQRAAKVDSGNDIPVMDEDTLSSIPAVHLTFDVIRCRVHILSQLVEAWPECVSVLMKHQQPMVCIYVLLVSMLRRMIFVTFVLLCLCLRCSDKYL